MTRDFQRFGGSVTLNSTPKGKRGKYYEFVSPLQAIYREEGGIYKPTKGWSYHEIHFTHCPRLASQEEELRREITEEEFLQEYCCEFVDESLSFFPYDIIWDCQTVKEYIDDRSSLTGPVYFGIDFGKRASETIVYVVEEYKPEKFRTVWIEVLPGVNYTEQLETIKQLNQIYDPVVINIDATGPGGQVMTDFLSQDDLVAYRINPCNLSQQFKEKIIIRLRMLMQRRRVELPEKTTVYGEKLERQLHSIQRSVTPSGDKIKYSGKQSGGMDDMVWALALAVYKETSYKFEPVFLQVKDEGLANLERIFS